MIEFQGQLHLPVFEGFTKFVMWPSHDSAFSLYSLVSKSPIPEQTPNCKGALMPYHPGFVYAALKSTGSPHDNSLLVFSSKPTLLTDDIHVMDVSERKVCECEFSFGSSDDVGEDLLNKTATEGHTESLSKSDEIANEGEDLQNKSVAEEKVNRKPECIVDENVMHIKGIGNSDNIIKVKATDDLPNKKIRDDEIQSKHEKSNTFQVDPTMPQPEKRWNPLSKAEINEKCLAVNKSKANKVTKENNETNVDNHKAFTECKAPTQTIKLPGQPEKGELPSSNLTEPSFSTVEKLKISAQKFPCFIPKIKRKVHKKADKMRNFTSKEVIKGFTEDTSKTETPSETKEDILSSSKTDHSDEVSEKTNQQLGQGHHLEVQRCLPQNKEYHDWMRSAVNNGGFPKDQNLNHSNENNPKTEVNVKLEKVFTRKIDTFARMEDLKTNFCKENKMNPSLFKFLFDGQRIQNDDTANSLGLENGDIIEVFPEMKGGGWPSKKNIFGDTKKILDILECEEQPVSSSDGDEEATTKLNTEDEKLSDKEMSTETQTKEKTGNEKECLMSGYETDNNSSLEESKSADISDSHKPYEQQISSVEEDFELFERKGEEPVWNEDNMQISENLKATNSSSEGGEACQEIMESIHHDKTNDERLRLIAEKDTKKDSNTPPKRNLENTKEIKSKYLKKLLQQSYRTENTIKTFENTIASPSLRKEADTTSYQEDTIENAPTQRGRLLSKFGINTSSSFKKSAKIREEEMKRFSIAVHIWAENKFGGIRILHELRLTDDHFKEILNFAGPASQYNLIKSRTFVQYKNLWRNAAKSKLYFRGHPETGFETENGIHNPSIQYCPFEHCKTGIQCPMSPLDMDLILSTPKTTKPRVVRKGLKSSGRQLFGHGCFEIDTNEILQASTDFQNQHLEKPSPTKEELKKQNRKLLEENERMKMNFGINKQRKEDDTKKISKQVNYTLMKCRVKDCEKEFITSFGLMKHQKKEHSNEILEHTQETCSICGKVVVQMDKHFKAVHRELLNEEFCEVCKKPIKSDMKKHRGQCISCPVCGKVEKKKVRLLKHIKICQKLRAKECEQRSPLDLTSPMKNIDVKRSQLLNISIQKDTANKDVVEEEDKSLNKEDKEATSKCKDNNIENTDLKKKDIKENEVSKKGVGLKESLPSEERSSIDPCNQKRTKYPFDPEDTDEAYLSEFEEDDSEEYTRKRRQNKDKLELELREIDNLKCDEYDGDDEIVAQFRSFMQSISSSGNNKGENSKINEPSTVGMYTGAVEKDILRAFHQLFKPFDSRWLLDCTTPKVCTFEGKERQFVSPEEPIYLTARVLRKALEKYDKGETGSQRATAVAATVQFMNFIELEFNNKLNLYGREPLERVMTYHNGVKSYINGTKAWKACNKEKEKTRQNNKVIRDYENPNHDAEVLERFQEYVKSPERLNQIREILKYSEEGAPKPSDKKMTEIGRILMGEIIFLTGCRPVVTYRLKNFAYVNKKPGFNPKKVTPEDCVLDEEHEGQKIYRRLDPNLPPKHLACKHQLEQKSAICPVQCEERIDPEGFNILVDWDKTSELKGASYLHLPGPIKDLLDLYDIIKSNFFDGRKSLISDKENWLDDENTPFFLNSSGSPFQSVDLKHLSAAMGLDVTAYSFRRIVSTWGLSHKLDEIRTAEEETLQHSLKVANDAYLQNKQIKPQTFTQTYIQEGCLIPESVRQEINKTKVSAQLTIAETEKKRHKKQHETLLKKKKATKQLQQEYKPLGPRHRILGVDRNRFKNLVQEISGENIEDNLKLRKPLQWRKCFVRTVCSSEGSEGEEIRRLWIKVYQGDLRFGVRDARLKAKEKNWPRGDSSACSRSQDRNSWIAGSFLKSLQTEAKTIEKKAYIEHIQ